MMLTTEQRDRWADLATDLETGPDIDMSTWRVASTSDDVELVKINGVDVMLLNRADCHCLAGLAIALSPDWWFVIDTSPSRVFNREMNEYGEVPEVAAELLGITLDGNEGWSGTMFDSEVWVDETGPELVAQMADVAHEIAGGRPVDVVTAELVEQADMGVW